MALPLLFLGSLLQRILWEKILKCFPLLLLTDLELGICTRELNVKYNKIKAAIKELEEQT